LPLGRSKQTGETELSGKCQLQVYADYVNLVGNNICTMKKNTEALLIANKEADLKVNVKETQ
jgi:hypothetical protein